MTRALHFQMSGRLIVGVGTVGELPDVLRQLGAARPMLVTDAGLAKAGLCDRVADGIASAGLPCTVFDRVEPDPKIEIVYECRDAARHGDCDAIVGLGGGSSLDIAKVTAVVLANGGEVADYLGVDNIPAPGLPTVMLPTTAGTGSEVTPIAVLSDKAEHLKKGIVSGHLYPDVALVDPALAVTLPPHVTAYTGVDALTHAVEAYTNKHAQPFIDTFALAGIRLIGENLRQAVAVGDDIRARCNMALASLYGGMCLGSVNTAAVHALAYPLGGTFDVPHGVANSLLLPYVMEFSRDSDPRKYAHIAAALGEDIDGLTQPQAAERSVSAVRKLCGDIGIVSRMRELSIPADAVDEMAEAAMKVTRLLSNNPRDVHLEDAKRIYRNAY